MFCAQYGNQQSYYGNIQLARFVPTKLFQQQITYGGWPDNIPLNSPMVNNSPIKFVENRVLPREPTIAERVAIIKRLRAELEQTEETNRRIQLRAQIDKERAEKERQFKLKARMEDDDTAFMLLN